MTDPQPGIFDRLSLNHWYKYLLYVGGVVLIVGFYFRMQFSLSYPTAQVPVVISKSITFAIDTIIIGVFVWIFSEIVYDILDYLSYEMEESVYNDVEPTAIAVLVVMYIVWIVAFIVWIFTTVGLLS